MCPSKQVDPVFLNFKHPCAIRFETVNGQTGGMIIGGTSIVNYVFLEIHYVSASTTPDTSTGVDVQYVFTE